VTIAESSAKFTINLLSCLLLQSPVYKIYRSGERTQDPVDEYNTSDKHTFNLTLWIQSVKKSRVQPTIVKLKPK